MAIVVRRYRRFNVTTAMLVQRVQATASINANFTNCIDINIDNATADFAADLNEFMSSLGFVFDAALVAVDVEAHGARHGGGAADAISDATVAVAGLVTAVDKTKLDGISTGASTQDIFYGTFRLGTAAAGTEFINNIGGFDDSNVGGETVEHSSPIPRGGTFEKFYVYHNTPNATAVTITYTIMKNGVATSITATLAANASGPSSDLVNTATVAQGDRITVRAVKNGNIVSTLLAITGSWLFRTT